MTLAFPIPEPASMIGEIGFDITPLLSSVDAQTPIAVQLSPVVVHGGMTNRADVAPEVFEAFFEALPAVATWKDPQGRLLWASPEYEWVTGKRIANVIGRSPVANWPGRSGEAILKRDAMVRDNRVPYLTTDLFEFDAKEKRRVTIRFPLLNDVGALDGTASLGLDHALLIHSARMLQELGEDGADFARFCDLGIAVRPVPPALPTRFPSLSD